MPIYIYHGDNIGESRKGLSLLLDEVKAKGAEIIYLDGTRSTRAELESVLHSGNLFYNQVIVIEGLLARMRGKEKDELVKVVASYAGSKVLALWEPKEVTKVALAPLTTAKVAVYKTPAVIFKLLESLYPGNYQVVRELLKETARGADPAFIFIMLARHIGSLLIAKSGDQNKLIPFQRSRLINQAAKWEERELVAYHKKLLNIDLTIKSGRTKLDYLTHLDLTLATLLH